MNLNTIVALHQPNSAAEIAEWREGFAWLAGGTSLFSEPRPSTDTLIDLGQLGWPALEASPGGLEISATCRIAELYHFAPPADWLAAPLIRACGNAADVVHRGRAARASRNSRVDRLDQTRREGPSPYQFTSSVHRAAKALPHLRPPHARRARLYQAGRRRIWRQAGDADRGSLHPGDIEDRASGQVGVHPRGAVHRRHDAVPDDNRSKARRAP